jgi:branched-chain amino acid transport system ATP-binding protein
MKPMLAVSELNAWYGQAQVLFGIDLDVRQGEIVVLLGRNGVGKTTTLKSVVNLLAKATGRIEFQGRSIRDLRPSSIARLGLGYVPEDRRIFTDLTVMENLEVGRQAPRTDAPHWTVDRLFELFPNLARMRDRSGGHMSGGEQQMLSIARTLMGNPSTVLLDEPSEGLAPVIVQQMVEVLKELKRQGLTVLLSEQNLSFAKAISDRAYVIEKGQIRFAGALSELLDNEEIRRAYLAV